MNGPRELVVAGLVGGGCFATCAETHHAEKPAVLPLANDDVEDARQAIAQACLLAAADVVPAAARSVHL